MILIKTSLQFDIEPIVHQVKDIGYFEKSLVLNETEGNILSGYYTTKKEYVNTPLGNVLKSLGDIGEARLLKLGPEDVYTAHTDPDDRYHLSIVTTPYSYIADLESDTLHHLPVDGTVWYMNTSIMHSAINLGGGDERVHLNVRVRMPMITKPYYNIQFVDCNKPGWKQTLYNSIMGYINLMIKEKQVTGFERVSETELRINCSQSVLSAIVNRTNSAGFDSIVEECK